MRGAAVVRWRGLLSDQTKGTRFGLILFLSIACAASVATQLSYVVIGKAHMMVVLALISVASLFLGPLEGCGVGAIAGLAELIHAYAMPLDVYERYFQAPWNSVLLLALVGFVMGVIFAKVDQLTKRGTAQRKVGLVLACLAGSLLFSLLFHVSSYIINSVTRFEVPTEIVEQFTSSAEFSAQALANFLVMAALALMNDAIYARRSAHVGNHSIRETFQSWLLVVMAIGYMIVASFSYAYVTVANRAVAEQTLQGQIEYLEGQLDEQAMLIQAVGGRAGLSDEGVEELHTATVSGVARGLDVGEGGIAIVADNDIIVSTNRSSLVGKLFEQVVGAGVTGGFDEALYDETSSFDWYMGNGEMGYARVAEMAYVRVARSGDYQLMVALPTSTVFQYRTITMAILSVTFLVVFLIMYAQASILLREVVVKGFDRTNESLDKIIGGDLDEVVDVRSSSEFENLSHGINSTVGTLKESIEQTKEAIERELATARAIQTSALPTVFPPFPEVDRFDIYASMDAAKEVGGDFYDFFLIDDHKLGFLIADVSGKGIPAALFMMAAKTEIANYLQSGISVSDAIETVNTHLSTGNDENMFVTMWAATLDYETGVLEYVNAGHNPPLLRHAGAWRWVRERSGPCLGAMDGIPFRGHSLKMDVHDELFLYTDGVSEACDLAQELYGEDRLESLLAHHCGSQPRVLVTAVRRDLADWADGAEQSDDITMLALEYGVAAEVTDVLEVPALEENLDKALSFVHAELGRRLCPISTQNQLDVALEELFINVCRFAYPDRDDGWISVRYVYTGNPSTFVVEITDEGIPFNPVKGTGADAYRSVEEASLGGLGLYMAKRAVDNMAYVRDDGLNRVVFTKHW